MQANNGRITNDKMEIRCLNLNGPLQPAAKFLRHGRRFCLVHRASPGATVDIPSAYRCPGEKVVRETIVGQENPAFNAFSLLVRSVSKGRRLPSLTLGANKELRSHSFLSVTLWEEGEKPSRKWSKHEPEALETGLAQSPCHHQVVDLVSPLSTPVACLKILGA